MAGVSLDGPNVAVREVQGLRDTSVAETMSADSEAGLLPQAPDHEIQPRPREALSLAGAGATSRAPRATGWTWRQLLRNNSTPETGSDLLGSFRVPGDHRETTTGTRGAFGSIPAIPVARVCKHLDLNPA